MMIDTMQQKGNESVEKILLIVSEERPELSAWFIKENQRSEVYLFRFENLGKRLLEEFSFEEIEDADREKSLRQHVRGLAI